MPESIRKRIQELVADRKALLADLVRGLGRMGERESYAWNYAYNERSSPIAWNAARLSDVEWQQAMQDAGWTKTPVADLRNRIKDASRLAQAILGPYEAE